MQTCICILYIIRKILLIKPYSIIILLLKIYALSKLYLSITILLSINLVARECVKENLSINISNNSFLEFQTYQVKNSDIIM